MTKPISTLRLDDNKPSINQTTWNDLVGGESTIPLLGVIYMAKLAINGGGAFLILNDDEEVMQHIGRMSELDDLVTNVRTVRANLKLPALS